MKYTKEQAMEAIRQHPELAGQMKLSWRESKVYAQCKDLDSDGVSQFCHVDKHMAAMILKSLERKGYLLKLEKHRAVYSRIIHTNKG